MAVSLSVIAAKDSAGSAIAGGLQAQDKSGLGTGPFTLGQVLIDGLAGVNMAAVTAANAVKVDGSAVTQPVSLGTTQNTNLANIDSATSRLTTSATNVVAGSALATTSFVVGSRYLSTPPTFTNGQEGALQISAAGRLLSDSNASQTGTWTVQPGNTANTTPWLFSPSTGGNTAAVKAASTAPLATDPALVVSLSPNSVNANGQTTMSASAPVAIASNQSAIPVNPAAAATGGATNLHFFSVTGAPAAVVIKASAGTLYGVQAVNTGAAPVYLKLYNVAAASVTVGTTVPLVTIPVPTVATTGAGISVTFPVGVVFGTAMSYTFTNVAADNDATAVAVGTTLNVQFA